ncbi:uncharacterized protein LOC118734747 [Rhagoletis pomonella]|uniref:uncharacterized protein LOC118734747 n=1 Tax=Rhagoletis pomonella TaxID=28610 RepID=UPI0017807AD5|nr:uncharacterized protein LOC118734747 [Rhagoletis pomonella]
MISFPQRMAARPNYKTPSRSRSKCSRGRHPHPKRNHHTLHREALLITTQFLDHPHTTNNVPRPYTYRSQDFRKCRQCCRRHSLRYCRAFRAMTPDERCESATLHRYCINCLATSHVTGACDSPGSCRHCGLAHHTLLYRSSSTSQGSKQSRKTGDRGHVRKHRQRKAFPPEKIPNRRRTESRAERSQPRPPSNDASGGY